MDILLLKTKCKELFNKYYECFERYGEEDFLTKLASDDDLKFRHAMLVLYENGLITRKEYCFIIGL